MAYHEPDHRNAVVCAEAVKHHARCSRDAPSKLQQRAIWLSHLVQRGLRYGLRNAGNSCYINATLQALFGCEH
eukprot:410131-Amphidinium_carterae.1